MQADIKGALNQINKSYKVFVHKGRSMSKKEVTAVLTYGIMKGYKSTGELSDKEVDDIIQQVNKRA